MADEYDVRKHTRRLASGKTTTVRKHSRQGRGTAEIPASDTRPPVVGSAELATAAAPPRESWWDDDGSAAEGDWWDSDAAAAPDADAATEARRTAGWADPELSDEEWAAGVKATAAGHGYAVHDRPPPPEAFQDALRFAAERDPAFARAQKEMRGWREIGEPKIPLPEMTPEKARPLGCDTPEGRARYQRLNGFRTLGYPGPLDQDGNIPDPDDPMNYQAISALADMRRRAGE